MSLNDDDADLKSDIPVLYSDEEGKHPITWVKNNAAITGTLTNVGRALRTQYPELHKLITTNTEVNFGRVTLVAPHGCLISHKPY